MRLDRLPPAQAERYAALECPEFATTPWVTGPPRRLQTCSRSRIVLSTPYHHKLFGAECARSINLFNRLKRAKFRIGKIDRKDPTSTRLDFTADKASEWSSR